MSTVSSSLSSTGLNFSGLASGIDSQKIIDGLTAINQRRVDQLTAQKDRIALKQTTFAALQAMVVDFQGQAARLGRSAAGAFDARTATSSDKDAVGVTAGTAAVPGNYTFTVDSLAQAQSVASAGFSDPGARIKEGTFAFRVGSGETKTVTIGPTNNTVQGLADAINTAGGDVRAAVINDGSANPYRLMLTATKTGAANTIQVTNGLTTGTGAAIDPTASTVQAATDAVVRLGSGPGAITVNSGTNRVTGLVPGTTLELNKADPAKPITVTVAADNAGAGKAVKDFVESFNKIIDFVDQRDDFDQEGNAAGTLLGSRDAADLQTELSTTLTSMVPGVNGKLNRLSALGISFNEKGQMQLDESKLNRVLNGQEAGVSPADVKRLFALTGQSNNNGVGFLVGSDKTKPSAVGQPYGVTVTAPATRGAVTAASPPGPSVTIDNTNNTLSVVVNGVSSSTLSLPPGTYTPAALAAMLQTVINSDPPLQANQVSVDLADGNIRVTSARYGSASSVEVASGTAASALGFAGGEKGTGTNVAGFFTVNGVTEAATGTGQVLSGNSGNANTDGLQLMVTAATATTAEVNVTQGVGGRLQPVLDKYLNPDNGRFKTIDNGFKTGTDDLDKSIARQTESVETKKQSLLSQFAAMETAVNKLRGLSTQLASLGIAKFN
jgi:flagellar hook-associated protein 2